MLSLTLLLLPLSVLAAPPPQGQLESRSQPIKPNWAGAWTPKSQEQHNYVQYSECNRVDTDNKNQALCDDCINMELDVNDHNGLWQLNGQTNLNDPNDWNLLKINGTCTLLVKNTAPTQIGNRDVAVYMLYSDFTQCGDRAGDPLDFENRSYLVDDKGTRIDFWLRSTAGLDLSNIAHP
ncbi:uncharacterized protein F4807DRAFT_3233 [Annulohypoxylon truncatum]|uniref:uncharacterized protein n=1 Tax=Annulohypoxylon truncatum TaxID=327061 RepID=UPI00200817C7|nr:uncharacterized protein F4807DRAFT_3233 [Annulohypoxylon truncatum]KAI1214608.1 hypothetical protein F4807DRAFT_3233 [Annulohypoxylon truncatum]